MSSRTIPISVGVVLLACVGCQDAESGAVPCPGSVAAACSDPSAPMACPATWPEARSDRSNCKDQLFTESTWECPQYFALRTTYVDWGRNFLYDKTTGELEAVVYWSNGGDACPDAKTTRPGNTLFPCTMLGDCQSTSDGGADGPAGD